MEDSLESIMAMGLTPTDTSDEWVRFSKHPRKAQLHEKVKETDSDLSDCESLWRRTTDIPLPNQVGCIIPIHIASVSAVVTAGHADGVQDKTLGPKFYLCKEETSTWAKTHIKFCSESENNKARLRSTSSQNSYTLTSFDRYIPQIVRDAANKYSNKFHTSFKSANPKLKKSMITVSYISFLCNEIAGEQLAIDDHIEVVHGI